MALDDKRNECVKLQTKLQYQESELSGYDRDVQEELLNGLKVKILTVDEVIHINLFEAEL